MEQKLSLSDVCAELQGISLELSALTCLFDAGCDRPSDHTFRETIFAISRHVERIAKDINEIEEEQLQEQNRRKNKIPLTNDEKEMLNKVRQMPKKWRSFFTDFAEMMKDHEPMEILDIMLADGRIDQDMYNAMAESIAKAQTEGA